MKKTLILTKAVQPKHNLENISYIRRKKEQKNQEYIYESQNDQVECLKVASRIQWSQQKHRRLKQTQDYWLCRLKILEELNHKLKDQVFGNVKGLRRE